MLGRDALIQESYKLQGSHETDKFDSLISRIKAYISTNGEDVELGLISKALQISRHDQSTYNFKECSEMAEPIFETLKGMGTWSILLIEILGTVIQYSSSYTEAHNLTQEAFDILDDDFADYKNIDYTKLMFNCNMAYRLGRAHYYDLTSSDPNPEKVKEINELFYHYLNLALETCNKHNLTLHKKALAVRKAIFEGNCDLVFECFAAFNKKDKNEKELLKAMQDEALEYFYYFYNYISTKQRNFFTGLLMKRRREALNISTMDMADALGTERTVINKLENGTAGASRERISKIADILGVETSYFRGHTDGALDANSDMAMHLIGVAIKGATKEEAAHVVDFVTMFMAYAKKNRPK